MGFWSTIISIFEPKKEKEMETTNNTTIIEEMNKNGGYPIGYMPPNTPKKKYESSIVYSCRKFLGSKKNYKEVERAGYKTLNTKNNFSDYILSARICLNKKQPIKLLKSPMGLPVKFPLINDLITILDYSIKSYKGTKW